MPKEDAFAICPYYKRNDRSMIYCEGVCSGCLLHLAFSSPDQALAYRRQYCRNDWMHCRIADMLNRKYCYTP